MRRFLLSLIALLSLSCGNTARPDYVIHIVGAQHEAPFALLSCSNAAIRIDVAQGTNDVLTRNGTITNQMVDIGVEIPSYGLVTQLQVTAMCPDGSSLIGSTPEFIPTGYGFVNIVVAPPSSCRLISTPTLVPTRIAPQLVTLGANVLVVGGQIDRAMASTTVIQRLDPVQLTSPNPLEFLDGFPIAMGLGTSLPISSTSFAFFSTANYGVYDATPGIATTTRVSTPFSLPQGAGPDSAVIDLLAGNGIAVVGGSIGNDATHDITWISADGLTTTHGMLTYARRRPAVAVVERKLLVVGGQAMNEPLFELVAIRGTDPGIPFGPPGMPTGEARYAPILTTNFDHTAALVALGSASPDDDQVLATTTYVLSRCSTSGTTPGCTVVSGPAWPDEPRAGFARIEHHVSHSGADDYETLIVGGHDAMANVSPLVDRIHFDAMMGVSIMPAGMLMTPRSQPGVANIGGGIVMVAGGADASRNPLGTVELCYPLELAPITSL